MDKFVPEENKVLCQSQLLSEKISHLKFTCYILSEGCVMTEEESDRLRAALGKLQKANWDMDEAIRKAQDLSKKLAARDIGGQP